jgi:hypothetical protein
MVAISSGKLNEVKERQRFVQVWHRQSCLMGDSEVAALFLYPAQVQAPARVW